MLRGGLFSPNRAGGPRLLLYTDLDNTKNRFRKPGGTLFCHFVQSFSADDNITPQEANVIGLEFAQRCSQTLKWWSPHTLTPTICTTNYVVNSVSFREGHKLHQSPDDLWTHQKVNDEICLAHGLSVLDECELRSKQKRMKPGEYQAGLRGDSWKLDPI